MSDKQSDSKIEKFISSIRELHPNMEHACTHGSCYRFHIVLKEAFPDAEGWINSERDHVVTRIGEGLYDITGRIGSATGKAGRIYHRMSASEIKAAEKWSYR